MTATNIIVMVLACTGLLFLLASLFGISVMPDFYTRLHAQGIGDTLGAFLLIVAMMVATGAKFLSIKLFLIFIILALTNPLGTNLMIIAAIHRQNYQDYENINPEEKEDAE